MKKLLFSVYHVKFLIYFTVAVIVFTTAAVFAQAPQGFSYQAVARDSAGSLLSVQSIGLRVSILKDSLGGATVYSETQAVITDTFGVFTMEIGSGTPVTGTFTAIDWGSASHFVQIEMDPCRRHRLPVHGLPRNS